MRIRLLPFAIAALLLSPLPGALAQEVQEPPAAPVQEAAPADDAQPQDAPEPEVVPGTQAAPETRDAQPQDPSDPADEPPAPETRDLQQIDDEREAARAVAASDDPDASSASTRVPLEEIKRYVGLFNTIREGYVDPVDDKTLMMSAIRGLLLDLDPHSAYLRKSDADAFDEDTTGAYDGIGVEVLQLPDGKVRVIAPIDDTPAAKAGIRAGDTIVAVDGRALTAADNEGHGPLRGPPGSKAVLTVLREGAAEPLEITVHRQTIRIASVRARMLEPGYGYVRIAAFQVDTGADFARQVERLQGEAGGALKGLVIDLRSNPGGLLTAAVQVADDLLDKGGIVSTRGRASGNDAEFKATTGDLLAGAPVVVIVDAGSASASEVLAGALHDNGRARIVGSRTFGKGSVQTLMPLPNGDAVKLTTARYYTPSGRSIQARGIDPDVVLKPDDATASSSSRYTEAALPGHLRGDEEGEAGPGDVLPGDGPIAAALAELKKPAPEVAGAMPAAVARD